MIKLLLDPTSILKLGIVGVVFFIAYFTFILLRKEQSRQKVRRSIIRATIIFMGFCLLLAILVVVHEYIKTVDKPTPIIVTGDGNTTVGGNAVITKETPTTDSSKIQQAK